MTEAPTIRTDRFGDYYSHPAFGRVVLSRQNGGNSVMFGSELRHNERMTLTIEHASLVRHLSHDRVSGAGRLLELSFTLSQWAQFVASQGIGEGTPCTLSDYREGQFVVAPNIAEPESHAAKFQREMENSVSERTAKIREHLDALSALVEDGRLSKRDLRQHIADAKRHAEQLPGSVAFVKSQFAESMEDITQKAKTEIEGFVAGVAMRTGLDALLKNAAPQLITQEKPDEQD